MADYTLWASIGLRLEGVDRAMRDLENAIQKAEQRFEGLRAAGQRMQQVGQGMVLTGGALAAGFGLCVKKAMDFDTQMARVKAISGATQEDFERLRATARKLGKETMFSASEAAQGMQFLAMAGFETNDIISAMSGLLDLAAAGAIDLASAADITSNIMSGFGIAASEAGRVADVLAKASSSANVDVQMLGETMKYAAPVAKSFGMTLEETTAIAAKMGDAGIQASMAGTALRAALTRLSAPSAEAATWLEQLGVSVKNADGDMRDINDIIYDLSKGFTGLSESERMAAAASIFGTEAMAGWLAVLDLGPEQLASYTAELEKSRGTARKMAEDGLGPLRKAMNEANAAIESVQIAIGRALTPMVEKLAIGVKKIVGWFEKLPKPVQQGIAIFGGLTAATVLVGGSLLMFAGFVAQGIAALGAFGPAIGAVKAALGSLRVAMMAMMGPVGIVVAAFIAAAYLIIKNWDTLKEWFGKFKDWLANLWNSIKGVTTGVWTKIKDFLVEWWPLLLGALTGPVGIFAGWLAKNWEQVKETATIVWNRLKQGVVNIINMMKQAVLERVAWLGENMIARFESIWTYIKGIPAKAYDWGRNILSKLWDGLKAIFGRLKTWFQDKVLGLLNRLNPFARSSPSLVEDVWRGVREIERAYKSIDLQPPVLQFPTGQQNISHIVLNFDNMFAGAVFRIHDEADARALARQIFEVFRQEAHGRAIREVVL